MNVHPKIAGARAFDAGRTQRRLRNFPFNTQSINSQIRQYGTTLVARSRHLAANNPYASAAKAAYISALVGTGIKPSALIENKDVKKRIMKAFRRWTDECDADGRTDFYGLQALIAGEEWEAGECFVRIRVRRTSDGLTVPVQLQVIPAEMLPLNYNEPMNSSGRFIEAGIEFDRLGRRRAYHFLRQHPGDRMSFQFPLGSNERVVVPASEVLHIYRPMRAGQVRGVPQTASGVICAAMLDLIDDAELERKRTTALFAAFITRANQEGMHPLGDIDQDTIVTGNRNFSLEPGALIDLELGEDIKFASPSDVGNSYEDFQYRNLLRLAAGFGVPYFAMTGDLRQTSHSSIRAGLIEFRRKIEAIQHNTLVPQFCLPVWRRWFNLAVLVNAIQGVTPEMLAGPDGADNADVKWIAPKWEWLDPMKDIQAEKMAVDEGFKSRDDVVEGTGVDPEENDERIKASQDRAKEMGIKIGAAATSPPKPPGAADDEDEDEVEPKPKPGGE